jgi:plasmid maintenance system antidote protein VapI
MKAVHVGSLVKLRLVQLGMTKAEFARRINKTPQNIHDLLTTRINGHQTLDDHLRCSKL